MKKGSIQQSFLLLDSIIDDVACVATPSGHTTYRAALAVTSVNFLHRTEKEQEAILASYAAFLNGLRFALQTLVQVRRLDLTTYLDQIQAQRAVIRATEQEHVVTELWDRLTNDYRAFVEHLLQSRTILERRFTVVVASDDDATWSSGDPVRALLARLPLPGQRQRATREQRQALAVARPEYRRQYP